MRVSTELSRPGQSLRSHHKYDSVEHTNEPARCPVRVRAACESVRTGPRLRIQVSRALEWSRPDRSRCRTPSPGSHVVETTPRPRTSKPFLSLDTVISRARTSLLQSPQAAIHRIHPHAIAILPVGIQATNRRHPEPREPRWAKFHSCPIAARTPSRRGVLQPASAAKVSHTCPPASPDLPPLPVAPQRLARGSAFPSIDEHLAIHHHARDHGYPTNLLACVGALQSGMREKAHWGESHTGLSASKKRRKAR
jgi:hypothetical protein